MNWRAYGRNWPGFYLRYYHEIWLEELRKTAKNLARIVSGPGSEPGTS
jgi:hypothetical protein